MVKQGTGATVKFVNLQTTNIGMSKQSLENADFLNK